MTPVAILVAAVALTSGLHGVVTLGPTKPVCQVGMSCSAPAAYRTLVFTRFGVSRRVKTDGFGRYRIGLVPGQYAVRAVGARFGFQPRAVWVRAGVNLRVNFAIDTGIR